MEVCNSCKIVGINIRCIWSLFVISFLSRFYTYPQLFRGCPYDLTYRKCQSPRFNPFNKLKTKKSYRNLVLEACMVSIRLIGVDPHQDIHDYNQKGLRRRIWLSLLRKDGNFVKLETSF